MSLILSGTDGLSDVDGSAATPAIRGTDANTGIFFPAADTIAFAEGGAEVIRIDASGRLLIGNTASVADAQGFTPSVQVSGTGALASMSIARYSANASYCALLFEKSRGATVGTNTIVSNGDNLGGISFQGANGTGFTEAAQIIASVDGAPGASADMPGRLGFYTTADGSGTPTERMRIDSSGNVGIGTSSPIRPLQVGAYGSGNGEIALGASTTGYNSILFGDGAGGSDFYRGYVQYQHNGDFMLFATAAAERMRIDSSGNLLLDTTVGNGLKIDFSPSTSQQNGINYFRSSPNTFTDIYGCGTSGGWQGGIRFFTSNNAAASERARIDSSGNFLVNTTSTGAFFDGKITSYSPDTYAPFAGKQGSSAASVTVLWNAGTTGDNIFEYFLTETSPTVRGTISYNRAGGLVAYNTTSDYRAKDISGPVTGSGALIDSIPVYMGTMKGATQERPMFIAHETPVYAHTGVKDAVDKDGNPVYQQMDTSALIPVMWAEIQELRKRLAALESN